MDSRYRIVNRIQHLEIKQKVFDQTKEQSNLVTSPARAAKRPTESIPSIQQRFKTSFNPQCTNFMGY